MKSFKKLSSGDHPVRSPQTKSRKKHRYATGLLDKLLAAFVALSQETQTILIVGTLFLICWLIVWIVKNPDVVQNIMRGLQLWFVAKNSCNSN